MIQLTIITPRFKYECTLKDWPTIQPHGEHMMHIRYEIDGNTVIKIISTNGLDIDMRRIS